MKLWWIIPPIASIANLPFLISFNFMSLISASLFPFNLPMGSNPKSPGTRSESANMSAMVILPLLVRHSSTPANKTIWSMPEIPTAAGAKLESSTWMSANMGKLTNCCAMNPAVASMATRPCLISDSWSHLMSKLSDQLMGSNPTEPMSPSVLEGLRRKGTDLDISALRAVDALPVWAGAKAEADPIRAAMVAIFIMVLGW
mmetsp:Transcript_30391/g.52030  ORF Transcript_30391/g.52030 Transcript_30391/m.52030 type:complete len:201 (-) Transcript_30391:98-700(-)